MHGHSTGGGTPVAYSYVRFSDPEQAKGDSLRRQTKAAADWCERNGVKLDASTTLHDLEKSAYTGTHRENPDRHALAAFLKLVEDGKVPVGSFLVVENLDRLSREHIQPALILALNLLQKGIRIVQLRPTELIFDSKSDTLPVMMMMMELSRGHSESAMKSDRIGAAWSAKKECARRGEVQPVRKQNRVNGMSLLTHVLPGWIEESGGKMRLIPERAAVVKRIFQLAAAGYGRKLTAKKFIEENVPAFGKSGRGSGSGQWNASYIGAILRDRRALGEHQPHKGGGRQIKDGEPIRGYFPAVITEEEWFAVQSCVGRRRNTPGRISLKHVNVFGGLLKNARDGSGYVVGATMPPGGNGDAQRRLINGSATEGRATAWTFPFATFERAILSQLREIDPHEILNGDSEPDETLALAGELAAVESKISEIESELLKGDVAALARVLRQLEERKRELNGRLATAREKAANPLSETWGQAQSLIDTLHNAPDPRDARIRLRSALRRIVDSIWMLVLPSGQHRLCAAQVHFSNGKRRDYLILHRRAKGNGSFRTEGGWDVRSITKAEQDGVGLALVSSGSWRDGGEVHVGGSDGQEWDQWDGEGFAAETLSYLESVPLNLLFPGGK